MAWKPQVTVWLFFSVPDSCYECVFLFLFSSNLTFAFSICKYASHFEIHLFCCFVISVINSSNFHYICKKPKKKRKQTKKHGTQKWHHDEISLLIHVISEHSFSQAISEPRVQNLAKSNRVICSRAAWAKQSFLLPAWKYNSHESDCLQKCACMSGVLVHTCRLCECVVYFSVYFRQLQLKCSICIHDLVYDCVRTASREKEAGGAQGRGFIIFRNLEWCM